jgi:hypothetical protein
MKRMWKKQFLQVPAPLLTFNHMTAVKEQHNKINCLKKIMVGFWGGSVTKYAKGITLDVVPLHFSKNKLFHEQPLARRRHHCIS